MPSIIKLDMTKAVVSVAQPQSAVAAAPAARTEANPSDGETTAERTAESKDFANALGVTKTPARAKATERSLRGEKVSENSKKGAVKEAAAEPAKTDRTAADEAAKATGEQVKDAKPTISTNVLPTTVPVTTGGATVPTAPALTTLLAADRQARVAALLLNMQGKSGAAAVAPNPIPELTIAAEAAVAGPTAGQSLPSAADVLAAMQTTARSNATVAAAAGTVLDAPTPEKPVIVAPETARPQANSTPVVVAASAAEGKPMDRLFVETWDEHEQAQQAWMSRPVAYAEALRSYRQIAADQPQATREPAETAAPEKAAPRASEAKAERVEAAKLHKATSTVDEADHAAPTAAKAPASSEAPAAPVDAVGQATASVEVKANPIVAPAPAAINHGAKTTAPTASPVNLDVEIARIERLVEATGRALLAKAAEGGGSMRLRLEPPELGHVRLDIQVSKDIVRAEAVVEHSQVKQALLDQMPQLRQTLADRGLDLQGFDVRQQLFDWSGQQNANGDRSFTWRDDGQRWPVEEARQSVAAASRSGGRRNFGGSISIMV